MGNAIIACEHKQSSR